MNLSYKSSPDESHAKFIHKRLRSFNVKNCEYFRLNDKKDKKYFGFYAYDKVKKVGGVYGWIEYENWAFIDVLYVEEDYKSNGIGSTLIHMVEDFAKKNKCPGIRTETWDFQALEFYKKNGFDIYGVLEDHPVGAVDYFLKKKF